MALVVRSILIWLLLIVAEIIHGILRAIVLAPFVGEFRASQIGVFTGSAIILVITCLTIRWIRASGRRQLLLVGFIWVVLTVAFEMLFGRFVAGLSWERLMADYNLQAGGLMPVGLLLMLFAPMIARGWLFWTRMRRWQRRPRG